MLRRSFLAALVAACGCSPTAVKKRLPPALITEEPQRPSIKVADADWTMVPGKANPNRVVLYLSKRTVKVKDCTGGICRFIDVVHPPSEKLRSDLKTLPTGWRVGDNGSQHIQVISIPRDVTEFGGISQQECPVAVKLLPDGRYAKTSCAGMSAAWLSKWYSDQSLPCPTRATYRKRPSAKHIGVNGESRRAYIDHLTHSGNHKDCHWLTPYLRSMSLDELRAVHDDSHAAGVQWSHFA